MGEGSQFDDEKEVETTVVAPEISIRKILTLRVPIPPKYSYGDASFFFATVSFGARVR